MAELQQLAVLGVLVVAAALCVPLVSDVIACWRRLRASPPPAAPRGLARFLVLVPAHNEALFITRCIQSVRAMRYPRALVDCVVLADNCSDDTAARARAAGAPCLERDDPAAPGKPQVIAWALPFFPLATYDAVVILDADAVVAPDFARGLVDGGPLRRRVVQPYNDVANREETALTRLAEVFASGRFMGAFPLKRAVGLNVPLSAGMCIGSSVLLEFGWRAFTLSEDWEWYALLTAKGVDIGLAPSARLYAYEAPSLEQARVQRGRWSAGRRAVLRRHGLALLSSGRIGWHQKLDALGELIAPGPAMHAALVLMLAAGAFATLGRAAVLPVALLTLSLGRPAAWAVVGWRHVPDRRRAARAFFLLPFYACWRFVIGFVALPARGTRGRWRRAARPITAPPGPPFPGHTHGSPAR